MSVLVEIENTVTPMESIDGKAALRIEPITVRRSIELVTTGRLHVQYIDLHGIVLKCFLVALYDIPSLELATHASND